MAELDYQELCDYVNREIVHFHEARLIRLNRLRLNEVLKKKNPYLFRAKNIMTGAELVSDIMDAFLSSSEEKMFGDFLEGLAIFVCSKSCGGKKSSADGMDLEFDRDGTRYVVSIKSGPSWGNSSQHLRLEGNFKRAVKVLRQSADTKSVQPVLGICYGKQVSVDTGVYIRHTGQAFWFFLCGDPDLYTDIIEPIGFQAKQYNDDFEEKRAQVLNRFTKEFLMDYCTEDQIDWEKLVQFNSGNM